MEKGRKEEEERRKRKEGRRKKEEGRRKQSQKRYMVSGSIYPIISIIDVTYSVSFAVGSSGPVGEDDHYL